jgi:hypothetical protein
VPFPQSRDVLAFQGPWFLEQTTRPDPCFGKEKADDGEGSQALERLF